MKQLYFLQIDPLVPVYELEELLQAIGLDKADRLSRYRYDRDRKIGLYAEILLRSLIAMTTGTANRDIDIRLGRTGKPYLASTPWLEFNVTHTRYAVAVALSNRPVGVDIEKIRPTELHIAPDIFTENELRWLNQAAEDRPRRFVELWTKKEALVKHDGDGLPSNLKTVDVMSSVSTYKLSTFMVRDFILSVCSAVGFEKRDLTEISEAELINMWHNHAV